MSLLLRMIAKNAPLHAWPTFVDEGNGKGFSTFGKNDAKIARYIYNSVCHPKAVELIAREYPKLPPSIRMELRELCNSGAGSNNVTKGVQRLNEMLRGELLREEKHELTFNRLINTPTGVRYKSVRVDPAKAGAQRKYASY